VLSRINEKIMIKPEKFFSFAFTRPGPTVNLKNNLFNYMLKIFHPKYYILWFFSAWRRCYAEYV